MLSTPLDRVRTVDLTASPIHRILGLTTRARSAPAPRRPSRTRSSTSTGCPPTGPGSCAPSCCGARRARPPATARRAEAAAPASGRRRRPCGSTPSWLRFAPFTSAGVVMAAAVLGVGSQLLNTIDFYDNLDPDDWSLAVPIWTAVMLAVAGSRRRGRRAVGGRLPGHQLGLPARPRRPAPGTCPAACSPPARPAWTTSGVAGVSHRRAARPPRCPRRPAQRDRDRAARHPAGQLGPGAPRPATGDRPGGGRGVRRRGSGAGTARSATARRARRRRTCGRSTPAARPRGRAAGRSCWPTGRRGGCWSPPPLVVAGRGSASPPTAAGGSGTCWSTATSSRGRAACCAAATCSPPST